MKRILAFALVLALCLTAAIPAVWAADTQPKAPTGITTGNNLTTGRVKLTWKASSGAAGYNIYRASSEKGTYSKLNDAPVTALTYTDGRSGNAGTTYWYKVTAVKGSAESARSAAVSGVSMCQRPTNLKAAANHADGTVTLTWDAPAIPGSVSGYRIYKWNSAKSAFEWIGGSLKAAGTATSVTIPAQYITRGEKAQYSIRGFNTRNTVKSLSIYAVAPTATVEALPAAPTGITAANNLTTGRVKLSWKAVSGAEGYNIYRAATEKGTYTKLNDAPVTALTYTDGRSGNAGNTYWYKLTAVRGGAEGARSAAVSRVSMCQRPDGLKATANSDGSVLLSWSAPAIPGSVSGYRIYLWDTAKSAFQWIGGSLKADGAATSAVVPASALSAFVGKTAQFSIRGYNTKNTLSSLSTYAATASAKVSAAVYQRRNDGAVYDAALGEFEALMNEAKDSKNTLDERYVRMAKAEAALLDSAVMIPTTTQGGAYVMSRIAPRTTPYVQWGNDDDRWFGLVIADEFLTPAERSDLLALWSKAAAGEGAYDPATYLKGKGHALKTEYTTTFSTAPATIDWLNTSSQSDTEITVQTVAGLVQYDNMNQMTPMLAQSWDVSDDGTVYTFHIRPDVYWYTSAGEKYAEVTAQDFVSGFRHMLDAQAGLEWLVEGVVKGAGDYLRNGGSFDNVGYAAPDKYTLVVTLEQPVSYFMTMLTYSCFLPICDSFYKAHGGVFGIEAFANAVNTPSYTFGSAGDVTSQVYCGPFLLRKLQAGSEILAVRNASFFNNSKTTLNSIRWVYNNGENPDALYADTVSGVYGSIGLTAAAGTLDLAKSDGNFDKYAYISETSSTTYFGGLNLNRGTFALANGAADSGKTELQKISTAAAMQNRAFRQAVQFAFDKGAFNAVSRGEDLKYASLRNMYTHPEFVSLSADTTADGVTFKAGTFYGEMVQYYLKKLGSPILVDDQIDGWYHPETARERLAQAKRELGASVSWPIVIDVVYYSASDANTAQAQAYKSAVEGTLGAENVRVNLVETTNSQDFYDCGYRAPGGAAANYDMFYGSGWGPDYGDPSTYLDSFLGGGAGHMTYVLGLY